MALWREDRESTQIVGDHMKSKFSSLFLSAVVFLALFGVCSMAVNASSDTTKHGFIIIPDTAEEGEYFNAFVSRVSDEAVTSSFEIDVPPGIRLIGDPKCDAGDGCTYRNNFSGGPGSMGMYFQFMAFEEGVYTLSTIFTSTAGVETISDTITITQSSTQLSFISSKQEVFPGEVFTHSVVITPADGVVIPVLTIHFGDSLGRYDVADMRAWVWHVQNTSGGGCTNWPDLHVSGYVECHLYNIRGPITLDVPYLALKHGSFAPYIFVDRKLVTGPMPSNPGFRDLREFRVQYRLNLPVIKS